MGDRILIEQKTILDFIDAHYETIKKDGLALMVRAWLDVTPEMMKEKWVRGSREHEAFHTGSIPDPYGNIVEEIVDSMNYAMVPALLWAIRMEETADFLRDEDRE